MCTSLGGGENTMVRRLKRTFFVANRGAFILDGISRRLGPYLSVGYREGPVKLKTSVGLQGHKASASVLPHRRTEIGIEKNYISSNKCYLVG